LPVFGDLINKEKVKIFVRLEYFIYFSPAKTTSLCINSRVKMTYIKREIEYKVYQYIDVKEIIAITGIRQCGKTTLLKKIAKELTYNGKTVKFISFDDVRVLQLFEQDIESFISIYVKPYSYLFIDEIQYARESGRILKYIYDTSDIKMFVSGSSAIELSVQSLKYLVGRIFTFNLFPFSFREFIVGKEPDLLSLYDQGNYGQNILQRLNAHLVEFLLYGGFPRVVTAKRNDEKKEVLKNIYNTYLLRELKDIFQLADDYKIIKLLKLLALQTGNLINFNEIATATGIDLRSLKRYINILEKTFILSLVKPFHTNKRIEIVKSPKVYFLDPGFRNICIDNFSRSMLESGEAYEQFVFSELNKYEIVAKYWRTKSGAEVDFILEQEPPVPIEVNTTLKSDKVSRAFHSFIEKYKPIKSYYFSLEFEHNKELENVNIQFLPFVKLNRLLVMK